MRGHRAAQTLFAFESEYPKRVPACGKGLGRDRLRVTSITRTLVAARISAIWSSLARTATATRAKDDTGHTQTGEPDLSAERLRLACRRQLAL
jgi:hypothetical protein